MNVVIDASAAIDYLLDPHPVTGLRDALLTNDLYAPHLIDFEVASAMRGLVLARKLQKRNAYRALANLRDMEISRLTMTDHLPTMLELADNFTAYDAAYVALARSLDVPLLTSDAKFAPARRLGVAVKLLAQ